MNIKAICLNQCEDLSQAMTERGYLASVAYQGDGRAVLSVGRLGMAVDIDVRVLENAACTKKGVQH